MRAAAMLVWLLASGPAVLAQDPAARDADAAAVKDLVSRYNTARDRRDPAAIRALFAEDADQLVSSGEWRHGREQLVEGMLRSSRANPGARTLTVETIRFVGADVAIADARYEIAGAGGTEPRRMWSTFVAVRAPGGWRLSAIRNMLPAR